MVLTSMRSAARIVAAAAVALASASAVAQPRNDPPRTDRVAPISVSASFLAGVWANGGPVLGGAALARIRHFDLGAEAVSGTGALGPSYVGVAFDAGVAWQTPSGWRLDALGALGEHAYSNLGDTGASGQTGFFGARLLAGYVFGEGPAHVELGVLGFIDHDFDRYGGNASAADSIDATRYGAALTLTFGYDAW